MRSEDSFADDDKLQHSVHEQLRRFSKEFYMTSVQHPTQRWKKCADNEDGENVPIMETL